jgi:uncharacterized protein
VLGDCLLIAVRHRSSSLACFTACREPCHAPAASETPDLRASDADREQAVVRLRDNAAARRRTFAQLARQRPNTIRAIVDAQAARATIERFYAAFDRRDGDAMAACYAPGARFSDPVFGELRGAEPGAMWRMLTGQARDLRVELLEHAADGSSGSARWRAHYTFSQTGRAVVNEVRARFRFAPDGLIAEHDDEFSFHGWSRQALGPPGLLLGWTPLIRRPVGRRARAGLDAFMERDAQSSSA